MTTYVLCHIVTTNYGYFAFFDPTILSACRLMAICGSPLCYIIMWYISLYAVMTLDIGKSNSLTTRFPANSNPSQNGLIRSTDHGMIDDSQGYMAFIKIIFWWGLFIFNCTWFRSLLCIYSTTIYVLIVLLQEKSDLLACIISNNVEKYYKCNITSLPHS